MGVIRLGVLGGTFNPVHFGHLHIARQIQKIFSLSEVHFVVAAIPPHKSLEGLVSLTHRYAMVSLATADVPSFVPSLIELKPQASPFSVDTMRKLVNLYPAKKVELFFIAGGDSLLDVKNWRESEKLLTSHNIIFAMRPGSRVTDPDEILPAKAAALVSNFTGFRPIRIQRRMAAEENVRKNRIYLVDVGAPDISATRIRTLAHSGKAINRMVPRPVCEYIKKQKLYGVR